jgi:hypothetical protein
MKLLGLLNIVNFPSFELMTKHLQLSLGAVLEKKRECKENRIVRAAQQGPMQVRRVTSDSASSTQNAAKSLPPNTVDSEPLPLNPGPLLFGNASEQAYWAKQAENFSKQHQPLQPLPLPGQLLQLTDTSNTFGLQHTRNSTESYSFGKPTTTLSICITLK